MCVKNSTHFKFSMMLYQLIENSKIIQFTLFIIIIICIIYYDIKLLL
jgi:hypothetical protein